MYNRYKNTNKDRGGNIVSKRMFLMIMAIAIASLIIVTMLIFVPDILKVL